MRKTLLTLAALAAFGIALPVISDSASAETVVIKRGHRDNGWHHGWRHRERVVVRHDRRRHREGATIRIR